MFYRDTEHANLPLINRLTNHMFWLSASFLIKAENLVFRKLFETRSIDPQGSSPEMPDP